MGFFFFWKDKQNQQALKQAHKQKKREDPKKHNQKWNRRDYNWYHRNKSIVRNYYKELYDKECENLYEMEKFLEKYNLPKLNEEEAQSLNRAVTPGKIET